MTRTAMALLLMALLSSGAIADCSIPEKPDALPEGSVADRAAMLGAHQQVWRFIEAADSYLDCLGHEEEVAAGGESEARRRQRIEAHNAVVAQMIILAEALKKEIAAFNARR